MTDTFSVGTPCAVSRFWVNVKAELDEMCIFGDGWGGCDADVEGGVDVDAMAG